MPVTCPKCGGIMWSERFISLTGDVIKHPECFDGWHCLCGNIIDPVILGHREAEIEKLRKHRPFHWVDGEAQ